MKFQPKHFFFLLALFVLHTVLIGRDPYLTASSWSGVSWMGYAIMSLVPAFLVYLVNRNREQSPTAKFFPTYLGAIAGGLTFSMLLNFWGGNIGFPISFLNDLPIWPIFGSFVGAIFGYRFQQTQSEQAESNEAEDEI